MRVARIGEANLGDGAEAAPRAAFDHEAGRTARNTQKCCHFGGGGDSLDAVLGRAPRNLAQKPATGRNLLEIGFTRLRNVLEVDQAFLDAELTGPGKMRADDIEQLRAAYEAARASAPRA